MQSKLCLSSSDLKTGRDEILRCLARVQAAPELLMGDRVTEQADVYSYGVVLWVSCLLCAALGQQCMHVATCQCLPSKSFVAAMFSLSRCCCTDCHWSTALIHCSTSCTSLHAAGSMLCTKP